MGLEEDPPLEQQKLMAELRRMEVDLEHRKLELSRAQSLDEVEKRYRRQEVRALRLDNDAKKREHDSKWYKQGAFWTRAGLLVAWIAALVPVWISVNQYWDGLAKAAVEERRVAAAERKTAIQDTARRFSEGATPAAFELSLYPEGVSILVGQLQWGSEGPITEEEIEKARAALIALQSASTELTDDQRELLRQEREQLLVRLEELARRWEGGQDRVGEQEAFLAQYEVHRRLRRLLGDEGDGWTEAIEPEEPGAPAHRGEALEKTHEKILERQRR